MVENIAMEVLPCLLDFTDKHEVPEGQAFHSPNPSAHQREATMETAATMKMVKALARSPEAAPHLIVQPGDIVSVSLIILSMAALLVGSLQ